MKRLLRSEEQVIQREIDRAVENRSPAPERQRIAINDTQALLLLDIRRILTGEVQIVDPRERPPR